MGPWGHGEKGLKYWGEGIKILGTSDILHIKSNGRQRAEAQTIFFLNPFTIFSLCKQKFVICPFVDEETKGSYPFANRLAHLYLLKITCPALPCLSSMRDYVLLVTFFQSDNLLFIL
jgi:hypothetical protein